MTTHRGLGTLMRHSAASQTAAQMARHGLLTLETGTDARQRIARLTGRARALLPLIEAEWAATAGCRAALLAIAGADDEDTR